MEISHNNKIETSIHSAQTIIENVSFFMQLKER